ncbi:M20 family metallo-hydrolase [Candidatus Methylacidiphilum infernorum]|uniref:Acetylornithine deacetylase/Succinyl-diaminopimelate desuccinylase or related deacylase n=1 Tax=Methylacidiphilum infernorum (isolate V4) TaxID=481448 RepID=B3E0E6_METI4|nr:M20 family metallo-hydrolase [Candidatus Methylacidiphilum infernorum]ACD84375.1 Acetylornithine deacetylase/Succinyl-diaminopimelate desuccinylase or related deacylase [Methylacidiphilum infernorum V4]
MKKRQLDWLKEADKIGHRLEILGHISERNGVLDRPPFSASIRKALEVVGSWMEEAGLIPTMDAFGNLRGAGIREKQKPALLIGSHLDTVPGGGRFDGALGIVLGITAASILRDRMADFPFAIDVIAFQEEEGVRFRSGCLGSRAFLGLLEEKDWELKDASGISVRQARDRFSIAGWPLKDPRPEEIFGYFEAHIEQGPLLETMGLPLGVVSGIVAQQRLLFRFRGEGGHAGCRPMKIRHDALCAAAAFVSFVEDSALAEPEAVATVGEIHCRPGAVNMIPHLVELAVDIRHPQETVLDRFSQKLQEKAIEISRQRLVEVEWQKTERFGAVGSDPNWQDRLSAVLATIQGEAPRLWSGAGHDAAVFGQHVPMVMLFVRCRGGISHDPAEWVSRDDIALALKAMVGFIEGFLPSSA